MGRVLMRTTAPSFPPSLLPSFPTQILRSSSSAGFTFPSFLQRHVLIQTDMNVFMLNTVTSKTSICCVLLVLVLVYAGFSCRETDWLHFRLCVYVHQLIISKLFSGPLNSSESHHTCCFFKASLMTVYTPLSAGSYIPITPAQTWICQ